MTISILGTKYKIIFEDFGNHSTRDAYCDPVNKEIHISNQYGEEYTKHSIRHEITHAFFFESGLEKYFNDEDIVSYIALQFDKIQKAFAEAENGRNKKN